MNDIIDSLNHLAEYLYDRKDNDLANVASKASAEIERLRGEVEAQKTLYEYVAEESVRRHKEIERLRGENRMLTDRVVTAEKFFDDRPKRRSECHTLDDWRMMAEHYEYQWSQCSTGYNRLAGDYTRALDAERQRSRLPAELVERLRNDVKYFGTTTVLLRDILAAVEGKE